MFGWMEMQRKVSDLMAKVGWIMWFLPFLFKTEYNSNQSHYHYIHIFLFMLG